MSHTRDSICRGALVLRQPGGGYRFNVDSVILAQFCVRALDEEPREVVDLGTGCGVVGLLLARLWPGCRVRLVELQQELADLARLNVQDNELNSRVEVQRADLRDPASWPGAAPDLLVSNPPFFRLGAGRQSRHRQVAVAKHEVSCTLEELVDAAAASLVAGKSLALIHAADRRDEVLEQLRRRALAPCLVRMVRPLPGREHTRVLVLATKTRAGACEELPELLVEQRPGRYSAEIEAALEGRLISRASSRRR